MHPSNRATPGIVPVSRSQIAPWSHLVGFFAIMAGTAALGFRAQQAAGGSGDQLASHGSAISVYVTAIGMDWALLYYCWVGVHRYSGSLNTLSGGRWHLWSELGRDLAIALPFWVVWEGVAFTMAYIIQHLLGPDSAKNVESLLPRSIAEVLLWIALSVTAGFCEELAFRGYLQRQLHALSGNIAIAVLVQALVFGFAHAYQGWKQVLIISVLGVLYGALAAWRRHLGANVIAHAWSDIWEGWLKFVVWK